MPWGSDVLSQAVILSCPVAACYAARAISKLTAPSEERSSGCLARQRSVPVSALTIAHSASELKTFRQGDEVLQYSNATFSYESGESSDSDNQDEDDDFNFVMLTPQQAQGALGDHATQFKKIYINGLTFIEQSDEQGMVVDSLSLDEYARRIQSVVTGGLHPLQSCLSSAFSSPCLSPRDSLPMAPSLCVTDSGASSALSSSCCSAASAASSFIGGGRISRNSLDEQVPPYVYGSQEHDAVGIVRCVMLKGSTEEADGAAAVGRLLPQVPCSSPSRNERMALTSAGPASPAQLPAGTALVHPEGAQTSPPCAVAATRSLQVPSTSSPRKTCTVLGTGRKGSCPGSSTKPLANQATPDRYPQHPQSCRARKDVADWLERRRTAPLPESAAGSGPATLGRTPPGQQSTRRRGLTAASCVVPPPLPTPDPRTVAVLSPISPRKATGPQAQSRPLDSVELQPCASCPLVEQSKAAYRCGSAGGAAADAVARLRSAPQAMYPRTTQGGANPTPHAACSPAVGLSKAPALPLPVPDDSSIDASVPPALRYYLAQARAAGAGDEQCELGANSERCGTEGCSAGSSCGGSEPALSSGGAAECSVSQRGFVRATVEQFNTQRVVRCHVTPFAAAKTSRTPRTLTPRGSPVTRK